MRNWTGLVLFVGAAWFLYSAFVHRRRVVEDQKAARERGESAEEERLHSSLALLRDVMPPLILFALGFLVLKLTFAYWFLDGGRFFSLFDLAGVLGFAASYGTWIVLKTKYRPVARPPVSSAPSAPKSNLSPYLKRDTSRTPD